LPLFIILQIVGNSIAHARPSTSHSPDAKRIRIGEEEVPVPLAVQAPWGSCDDEGPIVAVPPEEEEVVLILLWVQVP
jgi:hypothetical protein